MAADRNEVRLQYLTYLGLWNLPKNSDPVDEDCAIQRVAAQVVRDCGVRPWEIGQMTVTELLLYTVNTEPKTKLDPFTAHVQSLAFGALTIEQRIELARLLYS